MHGPINVKYKNYSKCTYIGLNVQYCYSCNISIKLKFFFWTDSEISSNVKFGANPSSDSRVISCGRRDRHDEANSRFWQLCGSA